MAKTLSKTGIATDGTITAAHVTQSIDALTGTQDYDITITGNTVVASLTASANVDFNGDLDVDGITNLDVVDIDGAVDMASNLVVASHITSSGNISSSGTITANAFTGDLTGQASTVATIAGLAPNTATTQATQAAITTAANLTTVGALNAGSITSGFTSIDVGAGAITTTGIISTSTINASSHITASGDISASGDMFANNLTLIGDITSVGDDVTITDDVSIGGKLDVVGLISGSVIRAKKHLVTINNVFGTINQTMNPATFPAGAVTGITQTTSNNAVTVTLPAVEGGLSYEFIATANSTGAGATTFSAPSSNLLHGIAICDDGTEDIDGTNFIIAATKFIKGTRVYCVSDGTIWHITAFCLCTVSDVSHS
tara:strand:- start:66 stop:1184 length:1119 start_codon:yes stop_codon:yes gene_type:complete